MLPNKYKIAILGDGGWGTTLAIILAEKNYSVTLWGAFPEYIKTLQQKRINSKFLPGIKIPSSVSFSADLNQTIICNDIVVIAVPSQYLRDVVRKIKNIPGYKNKIFLSVTKGIELKTLKRMSEVIRELLGNIKLAVLSGPTIAHEIAVKNPATAVIASGDRKIRKTLQHIFMTERFRIYTNSDIIGVELGGSLKNIIAIASGICDGLGFGTNAKAALLSRGLAEISRLGKAMGAKKETFSGISGLGDLVTTCVSSYSRNRYVGEQIGKGKTLERIQSHMQMIAEGVPTTKSAYNLSKKYNVRMPITSEVYAVLYKNKPVAKAVKDLMTRDKKEETD